MSHNASVSLVIANGGTDSPALSVAWSKGMIRSTLGNAADVVINAPAALTGTCTLQVSDRIGGTWVTVQQDGTDVALHAGKATQITMAAYGDMRIHSDAAEGATRTFIVTIQIVLP